MFRIFIGVCKKGPSEGGDFCIETCWFYTILYNIYYVFRESGSHFYGMIWIECGPQHCNIKNPKLYYGKFVHQYCTLSMAMTVFLCSGYHSAGIRFVRSCHNSDETSAFWRNYSMEGVKKLSPSMLKLFHHKHGQL